MEAKQGITRVAGAFRDAAARVTGREQLDRCTDRLRAELAKGSREIVRQLNKHHKALAQLQSTNAVPELVALRQQLDRTCPMISANAEAVVKQLKRMNGARAKHGRLLKAVVKQLELMSGAQEATGKVLEATLEQLELMSGAQQAHGKRLEAALAELRRACAAGDSAGAVGLSQWLEHNADLARIPLVVAMLEHRRKARGAAGSTGLWMFLERLRAHLEDVSKMYELLAEADRSVFLKWIMRRYCDLNTLGKGELDAYDALRARVRALPAVATERVGSVDVEVVDLSPEGIDLRFLRTATTVLVHDFCLNQYHHPLVQPRAGDVLLDLGGYTGDTAIMFGHNTGYECSVHSFELSEANIEAFSVNLRLNPRMEGKVQLNRLAVADTTGTTVAFEQGARKGEVCGSVRLAGGDGSEALATIQTVTIDDYVEQRALERVDTIKMDIEGAERLALRGAARTIARFKPRLAIALYHQEDDLFVLPRLMLDANPGYRFGFKWCNKRRSNEAVLFAFDEQEPSRA